jgi:hypothetical protein
MNKVTAVKANDDFSLDLRFSDGTVRRFDTKPYPDYEVFRELKDLNYFRKVDLAFGTGRMSKTSARRLCTSRACLSQITATAERTRGIVEMPNHAFHGRHSA